MLDQIRRDIQSRLDELLAEADKLRRALAALASRDSSSSTPAQSTSSVASPPRRRTGTAARSGTGTPRTASGGRSTTAAPKASAPAASSGRTTPGATKATVLAALKAGDPMTAGEIATATGLGRATISTTLSRLAKSGEVTKADRGYVLKGTEPAAGAAPSGTTAAS